jgi:hypothetical protein
MIKRGNTKGISTMGFFKKEPTMVERENKKGLSTIVATLLIILLVLVAVGIIWVVLKNVIQDGAEQVSLGKMTLNLEILQIQKINDSALNVKVKRNAGDGEFVGINFIIDDGENTEVVKTNISLRELEAKSFRLHLLAINASKVKKISIVPIFKLESGKEVNGDIQDEYTLYTIETTCTPSCSGKQCGSNGCGGICGKCLTGYVCNEITCVQEATCTDNCSSLEYNCGIHIICGEDINCGGCGAGECSAGHCVAMCDLTTATWNMTNVLAGQPVRLNISGTNCNGKTITFKIFEKDGFLNDDDNVTQNPSNITFSGINSYGLWISEYQDDTAGGQSNPPEYYFNASVVGYSESITSSNTGVNDPQLLTVTQPISCGDGLCNGGETCSSCPADCGTCPLVCGNSIIEGTEQCDCGADRICISSELNGQTCESRIGTGYIGTLNCTSLCIFNTALCVAPCIPSCSGRACGSNTCNTGNCGTCSLANAVVSCSTSYQCVISSCNSGYANCDLNTTNGCETQLGTTAHCANCTNVCTAGQTCTNNVCVSQTPPQTGTGNTFYVAKNGNDNNAGTISQPFLTITYGISQIRAGDILYVRTGTYNEEVVFWEYEGTASNPLVVMAYPGEHPVIDGTGINIGVGSALVMMWGSYTHFVGFEVKDCTNTGIQFMGVNDLISNCTVHDVDGAAIGIYGDYGTVEDCTVYNTAMTNSDGIWQEGEQWGEAIDVRGYSGSELRSYSTVRNNLVYEGWGEGIAVVFGDHAIIEDNIIYNIYNTMLYSRNSHNVLFQRNLVYMTKDMGDGSPVGIGIWNEGEDPYVNEDITVINNIIYGSQTNLAIVAFKNIVIENNIFVNANPYYGVDFYPTAGYTGCHFENNIVVQEDESPCINVISGTGVTFSHNLYNKAYDSDAVGPGDIIGDPKFAKTGGTGPGQLTADYFKLLSNSPAINKGVVLSQVKVDYFGNARDSNPDIGAIEYSGTTCTDTCSSLGYSCGYHIICGSNISCGTCTALHCSNTCSAAGLCQPVCSSGYGNCDGNNSNGCETTLGTTAHCANCTNVCTTGQTCTNNVCVTSQTPTCSDGIQNQGETGIDCGGPCSACSSYSRTFYVSNSGSDSNSGTSSSAPWRTISKVNSQTFLPGDGILFKKGDSWHESLVIDSSGNSGNSITYGAYGTGNKPVINGFTTVSGWINTGSGIYSRGIATESAPVMVTVDGVNTGMGRTPNTGWTVIDSDAVDSLTDSDLNSAVTNWRGAEAVIRVNYFIINHLPITSHSGNTLYYSEGTVYQPSAGSGNGYFIQNDLRTLDQFGEWYYNPGTSTFYMYFGSESPSSHTIRMASLDNAVTISNHGYITFDGLSITGFNNNAFNLDVAPYITIRNCDITFCGLNVVEGTQSAYDIGASRNLVFNGNAISDMGNDGLQVYGGFTNVMISNNTFNNIGLIRGAGYAKDIYAHQAIMINYLTGTSNGNTVIEYNNFTNIGYIPINFGGTNVIIRYNYIDYYDLILDDGGGIYTYDEDSDARACTVSNNIVLHGMGDGSGRLNPEYLATEGIYTDGYSNGITITDNTVAYCSQGGYFSNSNTGGVVTDNTFYSNHEGVYINGGNGKYGYSEKYILC